jgi:DNA-binding winged helix-turn-helix (wHTH) protein/tetratricopeptide (TPR) repeat protein
MNRPAPWQALTAGLIERRPFRVGGAVVDPVSRDAKWSGGEERLQPQTLKVLITLFSRRGEVVTRDELVQLCWDGRIVGDDVINRSILLVRHLAEKAGGFEIETVPRTGYRLVERGSFVGSVPRTQWVTAAALLVAGAAGLFAIQHRTPAVPDAVMLKPFDVAGSAPLAHTFAAGVFSDVSAALSAANVDVIDPGASGQSKAAAFVLSGRAELPDSDLHLTTELQDARDHTVLWSTSFTRPAREMQAMQEQVSANLAAVLQCALDTSRPPGDAQLERDTIKLYLKACGLQQAVDPPSDELRDLLKQVTVNQPRFADGWARLAFWAGNAAFAASAHDAQVMRAEARSAAQRALSLDPKSAVAYNAIAELELGHVPFALLHRQFQKVLTFDPNDTFTINNECELLMRMGRIEDSLRMCRRGVELEPLSPEQVSDLVKTLIDDSRDGEAQALLQRALRIWPDDNQLKITHLDYEARVGDPGAALAILNDPEARPQLSDIYLEADRRLAHARKSGSPTEAKAFAGWLKGAADSGNIEPQFAIPLLARFGNVDDAFRIAFAAPSEIGDNAPDPEFLWEPDSASLRRDPRFVALAAKFHVADFWHMTGMWPDFCSARSWPYDCRATVATARAGAA